MNDAGSSQAMAASASAQVTKVDLLDDRARTPDCGPDSLRSL